MFIFLAFSFTLSAQHQIDSMGCATGTYKEYYPNGKVKSIKNYKNCNPYGVFKNFDSEGKIISYKVFLNHEIYSCSYFKNGNIHKETITNRQDTVLDFKKELIFIYKTGTKKTFDKKGTLISEENILKDKLHGVQRYYLANGIIERSVLYDNGEKVKLLTTQN
jgi:antitoxin component YwqK of YwqJK toxin-antitoxin module